MARCIVLKSGNKFWFVEKQGWHPYAFVVDKDNEFLGGFLGPEAVRKFGAFKRMGEAVITDFEPELKSLKYDKYLSDELEQVSYHFKRCIEKNIVVSDREDCNGTSSRAGSCSARRQYYVAANLANLYDNNTLFPLAMFIANHVSVFGRDAFNYTFFEEVHVGNRHDSREGVKYPKRIYRHLIKSKDIDGSPPPVYYFRNLVAAYAK